MCPPSVCSSLGVHSTAEMIPFFELVSPDLLSLIVTLVPLVSETRSDSTDDIAALAGLTANMDTKSAADNTAPEILSILSLPIKNR
jgi:hypothetical protein